MLEVARRGLHWLLATLELDMALSGPDGALDGVMGAYILGLAASFGISHLDAIHLRLLKWTPSFYRFVNSYQVLPCGRALFLLAFLQRGVDNQERAARQAVPKSEP